MRAVIETFAGVAIIIFAGVTGWGLVIYHHDTDGTWRVARDAWSTDRPIPSK